MRSRFGFTIVEILIVVAIIALLAAMAIPLVRKAGSRAEEEPVMEQEKEMVTETDQDSGVSEK